MPSSPRPPARHRGRHRARALTVGLGLAVALVGCGGGGEGAGSASVEGAILVAGTDGLRFEPDVLSAPAGTITFELACGPAVNHNLVIDETGEQVAACAPGQRGVGSVDLGPGAYTIVCTVPGHEAVMRGTLTVS